MIGRIAFVLGVCASLAARDLAAQVTRALAVGIGGVATRYVGTDAGVQEALSGVALAGGGALAIGPASLEGWYLEGRLLPDSGAPPARDLVEGAILLAVRPVRWVAVKGGAHLRAYVLPAGTERWVFGEVRVRADGALVGPTVRAYVEVWRALTTDANVGTGSPAAQGGEVGLAVRLPRTPFWGRLTYAIDQATIGSRTETLEAVGIAVGYGGR